VKLCLVYDCLYPWTIGGAERWMRDLAEALAADGHEVTFLTRLQWDPGDPPQIDGVRVIAGLLDTRDLAELYRRALGFIFPSLYEGFGMPILEAMASGCPVITADLSACPEVAGDAALLVNPRAVDAIQDAMETLLRDEATRLRLIQAGLERARQFDWKRSAACHAEVLRRSAGAAA